MSIPIIFANLLGLSIFIAFGFIGYLGLQSIGLTKLRVNKDANDISNQKEPPILVKGLTKRVSSLFGQPNYRIYLKIAAMVIGSRLILYLLGYFGVMIFKNQIGIDMSIIWNKWDAPHYLHIAENGYLNVGDEKFFIVFYPFYPLLVSLVNFFLHNSFFAAIIVSNVSLILAAIYLYKIVKLDFNRSIAMNSVKYLLIFPVSFFLGIAYTDSLFLALTVMTFYYMRKENWFLTGLFGCLACITRNFGILLLVPVLMEYMAATNLVQKFKSLNFKEVVRDFVKGGWYLFLLPFGQFIYWFINKIVTGDWFTYLTYQREHWNNSSNWNIINNFIGYINNAMTWKPADQICLWMPLIFSTFLALFLLFYGLRKIRISYLVYFLIYVSIYLTSTWLISGPRYLMDVFPIYICLALLSRKKLNNFLITLLSTILLGLYTLAFVMDFYVM